MQSNSKCLAAAVLMFAMTSTLLAQSPLPSKEKTKKTHVASSAVRQDVKDLRDLVTAQQQQLEVQRQQMEQMKAQIQQLLESMQQANAATQQAQSSAAQAQNKAAQAQQSAGDAERLAHQAASNAVEAKTALALVKGTTEEEAKRVTMLESLANRFRLGGDIRLRFEPLLQDLTPDRYRTRLRVRFGVEGRLNEDVTGGFYLATGSVGDDPVSSNQTLTGSFTRKPIGLDRGWITYQPGSYRWLQLTGGKFQPTWHRTSMTIDPDLNPEGFSEKFAFDMNNSVVKRVSFTGLQLVFNEVAGSNLPFALGNDSYAFGGQGSVDLKLGTRLSTTLYGTALNWRNTDSIIQAIVAKTLAGNRNTNATAGSGSSTTYKSQFLYADFIADTIFKTGLERWPLRFILDYVTNPRAASSQDHGFWGESAFGRLQAKNDIQVGYTFGRIEQDAVIAAFNESELRAPTNILQHRLQAQWLAQKNTTISFTAWIGRTLDRSLQNAALPPGLPAGEQDPYVKRLQADFIYKF